jgi:hypothetical protein
VLKEYRVHIPQLSVRTYYVQAYTPDEALAKAVFEGDDKPDEYDDGDLETHVCDEALVSIDEGHDVLRCKENIKQYDRAKFDEIVERAKR